MTFCHGCSKPYTSPLSPRPQCGAPQRTKAGHHRQHTAAAREKQSHRWHPGPCCWAASASQVLHRRMGLGHRLHRAVPHLHPRPGGAGRGIRCLTLKQPEFAQRPRAWTGCLPSCGDKPRPHKNRSPHLKPAPRPLKLLETIGVRLLFNEPIKCLSNNLSTLTAATLATLLSTTINAETVEGLLEKVPPTPHLYRQPGIWRLVGYAVKTQSPAGKAILKNCLPGMLCKVEKATSHIG